MQAIGQPMLRTESDWDAMVGWVAWICVPQPTIQLEIFVPRETQVWKTERAGLRLGMFSQASTSRNPPGRVWAQEPGCVLPVALLRFGFRFPRKEPELGGGERRENEETGVQRFRSWGSRSPQMACFAGYSLCDLG